MHNIACAIVFATITWSLERQKPGVFDGCQWLAIITLFMWVSAFLGAVLP
jgi:hypothetical protein